MSIVLRGLGNSALVMRGLGYAGGSSLPAFYRMVAWDLATLILGPGNVPLQYRTPAYVAIGNAVDIPIQCWEQARASPALFNVGDVPSATLLQNSTAPLGYPSAFWYPAPTPGTNTPTQNGYAQGQILASLSAADTSLLTPGLATLLLYVNPAISPAQSELVARIRLIVSTAY